MEVAGTNSCDEKSMAAKTSHGVGRVLTKLRASIDAGNYYEAHQMYRTLFFRYCSLKKYDEIFDLLYDGALSLLKHKQFESGADLSNLVVEVLCKSNTAVSNDLVEKLGNLFSKLKIDSNERMIFLNSALQWSVGDEKESKYGDPRLHQAFARALWLKKSFSQAHYHYIHSTDGDSFATMLIEYHQTKGYAMEEDLFIAQAVFQFLCLKNKSTATIVFYKYTERHPSVEKGPPYLQPLLNFLWFLLLTIDSGKLAAFTILCEKYQMTLKRDPTYIEYLDRIGQIFFGVPPRKATNSGGMLNNLLQSLLGGPDCDDDDDDDDMSLTDTPSSSSARQRNAKQARQLRTEELD